MANIDDIRARMLAAKSVQRTTCDDQKVESDDDDMDGYVSCGPDGPEGHDAIASIRARIGMEPSEEEAAVSVHDSVGPSPEGAKAMDAATAMRTPTADERMADTRERIKIKSATDIEYRKNLVRETLLHYDRMIEWIEKRIANGGRLPSLWPKLNDESMYLEMKNCLGEAWISTYCPLCCAANTSCRECLIGEIPYIKDEAKMSRNPDVHDAGYCGDFTPWGDMDEAETWEEMLPLMKNERAWLAKHLTPIVGGI